MIWPLLVSLVVHECGHYAAACQLGLNARFAPRRGFCVAYWAGDGSVRVTAHDRLRVSLAGPTANLALPFLWHPALVPSVLLGLLNLLPMRGSDGRSAWRAWREMRA